MSSDWFRGVHTLPIVILRAEVKAMTIRQLNATTPGMSPGYGINTAERRSLFVFKLRPP